MRPLPSLAIAVLLTVVVSMTAHGQYRREAGDTLRFHEVTRSAITLDAPQGRVPISTLHDATIALTFRAGDTAVAWYEALTIALRAPTEDLRPKTAAALRQSFTLTFDAHGRVSTVSAPRFPASFENVSDLTKQFADFFVRLPRDFDLTVGRTWTDTVVQTDTASPSRASAFHRIIDCRVLGDTVLAGRSARVIAARQRIHLSTVAPVPGQALSVRSDLSGEDHGTFIFSVAEGRMLGRFREGRLEGTVTYVGGPTPVTMRQHWRYTNVVDAVR